MNQFWHLQHEEDEDDDDEDQLREDNTDPERESVSTSNDEHEGDPRNELSGGSDEQGDDNQDGSDYSSWSGLPQDVPSRPPSMISHFKPTLPWVSTACLHPLLITLTISYTYSLEPTSL